MIDGRIADPVMDAGLQRSSEVAALLHKNFVAAKAPREVGALAIALGIMRDSQSAAALLEKLEAFERSLGGRIYASFKKQTGRHGRIAKTSLEMTLYFMRGLAMERIFRQNEAHYTHLLNRWKSQLRALLAA